VLVWAHHLVLVHQILCSVQQVRNFLTRSTWFLIILFFGVCLFLGWYQKNAHEDRSDFSNISEAPAAEQTEVKTDAPVVNTDAPVVEVESATDAPNVD